MEDPKLKNFDTPQKVSTMANSPANTSINRLLHVVNNPFGLLGVGRAAVESGSSSEDEDEAARLLV